MIPLTREEIERWLREGATVERHIVAAVTYERGYEEAADPIHRVGIASRYWDFDDAAPADRMRRLIEELAARLASAKAEGVREGIEMAARIVEDHQELISMIGDEPPVRSLCRRREGDLGGLAFAAAIRALSPPPAEPAGMTAKPADWTVADTELARDILSYLGIGSDASLEPGDRRRDRIAAMICADRERRTRPAEPSAPSDPLSAEVRSVLIEAGRLLTSTPSEELAAVDAVVDRMAVLLNDEPSAPVAPEGDGANVCPHRRGCGELDAGGSRCMVCRGAGVVGLEDDDEDRLAALEAENAALKAKMAEADRAMKPFAGIGAWLFARDLPDAMPLVDILGINGASGVLTRGDFKAAHTARAILQGGADAATV